MHSTSTLDWIELNSPEERKLHHIDFYVQSCVCDATAVCWCFWEKVIVQRCPQRSRMKNNNGNNIRTFKINFILLTSYHLSASVPSLFLPPYPPPPPTPPLWLREVNRATSSWLPNMKRFPKVQDSSLISSRALRLPASPALLRLSLSIHLPLLALSPAAHLSNPLHQQHRWPMTHMLSAVDVAKRCQWL